METEPKAGDLLYRTLTNSGESLGALSEKSPVLLVLLRHEGCTFCRNAMSDIARARPTIEDVGTRIVLGHMGLARDFSDFSARYSLADLTAVADPGLTLYQGLGLKRGRLIQLIGPKVLWAWLKATLAGHLMGRTRGDPFQLPGAFLLHHGQVLKGWPYRNVSDRPDYVALATP